MVSSLPPPPPPPPGHGGPVGRLSGARGQTYPAHCRWGLGDAGVSFAVFFGTSLVLGVIAVIAGGTGSDGLSFEGAWLPAVVIIPPLAQLAHLGWVGRAKGRGLAADFGFRFRWSDIPIGVGLAVAGMIAAGLVGSLVFWLFDADPEATVGELIENSEDGGGITIWIVALAVLASTVVPVVEELVYRGLWWSSLEKRGVGEVGTILITSTVFAVVHFEPIRLPILFVLGLALGFGRTRTRRIGAPIVAHMVINGLGMAFLLVELAE